MSEKLFALLLRLYPSHFREAYGDEALQLFRDRARDETGFFLTLRLWLDLLADFAFHAQPKFAPVSPQQRLDGMPSFHILGNERPRLSALFLGGVLSLAAAAGISAATRYAGTHQLAPPLRQAPHALFQVSTADAKLDAAERHSVIQAAIANLKQHYIDPDVAEKMANALETHEQRGDYNAITDSAAFANQLTTQMRDVSHDSNLIVVYSPASHRTTMQQSNCTFEKVEMLPRNIGYLKLNWFPDPSACQAAATAAMATVNRADAVIFDLRDNRGGFPDMVMLIAAYLFDHPEYMFNPRENTTERSWTRSPVPASRLTDKPVYVLTSARTISAAEHFSYDLKMLKRATLVGETTAGAAHAGVYHRIDDRFGMGITETRAINPYSTKGWEGMGVEPDIKVKAADALDRAIKLAEAQLRKK